jgi:hypothetical protein
MLLYTFTIHDPFDTLLHKILEGAKHAADEQAEYEGGWPEKYEVVVTLPPEKTEEGVRYYVNVYEV